MEPRNDQRPQQPAEQPKGPRQKRFRLVKLEERIAPSNGKSGTHHSCCIMSCGTQSHCSA